MSEIAVWLSAGQNAEYVYLTPTKQGKLYRKKILPMNGSFIHPKFPDIKIHIDKKVAESIVKNFNDKIVGHVAVPAVDANNAHSEATENNLGEVVAVSYDDHGVYAEIDARKFENDFGRTILDSSAFLHMNYTDTTSGKKVGPTLLHVAATNRGHVRNMGNYEEIIRASADNLNETQILFMTAEGEEPEGHEPNSNESVETMTKEEMLAQLSKDDLVAGLKALGTDVSALEAKAAEATELSAQFESAKSELKLSSDAQIADLTSASVELSATNELLLSRVEALEADKADAQKREAAAEVDGLIKVGRALPASRDALIKLSMSDRETFDAIIPDHAIVQLSEQGVTVHEDPARGDVTTKVAEYVARAQAKR